LSNEVANKIQPKKSGQQSEKRPLYLKQRDMVERKKGEEEKGSVIANIEEKEEKEKRKETKGKGV